MGVTDYATYEDFEHLLYPDHPLSGKEERENIRSIIGVEIISDLTIIAERFRQLIPFQLPKNNPQLRGAILAKIGERYTGHCIELWLWEKGYALNGLGINSFTIQPQYYQNNHFIDFKVEIIKANRTISLVVDSKNWARYTTRNALNYMNTHIQPFNSFNASHKLIFLNKRLISKVKRILQANNVEAVEINEHFTDKQYLKHLKDFFVIINSMRNSIMHLDKLIPIPDVSKDTSKSRTSDVIKYDIWLGKPYKLLQEKWEIRRSYIDNLRNQMKRAGIKLPKRNTRVFTRLSQYNDFFKRR